MIDTFIYIVYCQNTGGIKVGYSNKPFSRLATMQTGCPHRLSLVSTFIATYTDEQELHRLLQAYRLTGEWFLCCLESMEIITKFQTSKLNTSLSLELEDYFGTRNIPLDTLINRSKKYLVTVDKNNLDYQNILSDLAEEYLAGSKTRKRTRVPMSYLRTTVDIKPVEIRAVMTSAGYYVTTDKNNCIYFVRD
jgi:hypothetical protein